VRSPAIAVVGAADFINIRILFSTTVRIQSFVRYGGIVAVVLLRLGGGGGKGKSSGRGSLIVDQCG